MLIAGQYDFTICFITTQLKWQEASDFVLQPSKTNGIKQPSLVRTSKIATVDKSLAVGLLGNLDSKEIGELNKQLKQLFQLI